MRTVSIGGVLAALVVALSACGSSSGTSGIAAALQRQADEQAIGEIEKSFHEAMTKKDIDLMMSLYTRHATLAIGPGQTATGIRQIRNAWLEATPFKRETNWLSDHPAYKLRVTVDGDRGTLHFECHFVDLETEKVAAVTAADMDVEKIDGRWLIVRMVGGTAELRR